MLESIIKLLKDRNIEFDGTHLADALWLTQFINRASSSAKTSISGPLEDGASLQKKAAREVEQSVNRSQSIKSKTSISEPRELALFANPNGDQFKGSPRSASAISLPIAGGSSGFLTLGRILRPLRRRKHSTSKFQLDESATVERIAETQVWLPSVQPNLEPCMDLNLIIDNNATMAIWHEEVRQIRAVFEKLGAFRRIEISSVNIGGLRVKSKVHPLSTAISKKSVDLPKVVVILSDCLSDGWREGAIQQLLRRWGASHHVVILHMLPRHMWNQTWIGATALFPVSANRAAASNRQMMIPRRVHLPQLLQSRFGGTKQVPLPVFSLAPLEVRNWVEVVTGRPGGIMHASFMLKDAIPLKIKTQSERDRNPTAQQRFNSYCARSSPVALRLAALFAATPLTVETMKLVQRVMLPAANRTHLAEFFLGGLIKRVTSSAVEQPRQVHYDFHDGVRDLLLDMADAPDLVEVQLALANWLSQNRSVSLDFRAFLQSPETFSHEGSKIVLPNDPFTQVSASVLRRLGGKFAEIADSLTVGSSKKTLRRRSVDEIWNAARELLQTMLNQDIYNLWFAPVKAIGLKRNVIILQVANDFCEVWLRDNYLGLLEDVVTHAAERQMKVGFSIAPSDSAIPHGDTSEPSSQAKAPRWDRDFVLNPKNTFDAFVVDEGNQHAYAAFYATAQNPGTRFNPLFVYGGVGFGKTHLLHALGHYIVAHDKTLRVTYVPSETLCNQFVEAIQNNKLPEFRAKYRQTDVLMIDDFQFFCGKERIEEEVYHTFNALHDAHKQIVVACDRPPFDLRFSSDGGLVARFESGLVVDLQPPTVELNVAVLRKKSSAMGVVLPDEILDFLANHITTNLRRLEGALIRVASYAQLTGKKVTVEDVQGLLREILQEERRYQLSIEVVQKVVAEHFDMRLAEMTSKRRPQYIAFPRQIAMYLARRLTNNSLNTIAAAFGGREYRAVLYACRVVKCRMEVDSNVRQQVDYLEKVLLR